MKYFMSLKNKIKMSLFLLLFSLLFSLLLLSNLVISEGEEEQPSNLISVQESQIDLYLFYGQGCPHCADLEEFLSIISPNYPTLNIIKKEVWYNQENQQLFKEMAKSYGQEISGVPMVFIDGKVFVGFSESIGKDLETEIKRCVQEGCLSPADYQQITETGSLYENLIYLSIGIIIVLGICIFYFIKNRKK